MTARRFIPLNQNDAEYKGNRIRHRRGKHHSVYPPEDGQNQHERNQENHLSAKGEKDSLKWHSNGRKEIGGYELYPINDNHK